MSTTVQQTLHRDDGAPAVAEISHPICWHGRTAGATGLSRTGVKLALQSRPRVSHRLPPWAGSEVLTGPWYGIPATDSWSPASSRARPGQGYLSACPWSHATPGTSPIGNPLSPFSPPLPCVRPSHRLSIHLLLYSTPRAPLRDRTRTRSYSPFRFTCPLSPPRASTLLAAAGPIKVFPPINPVDGHEPPPKCRPPPYVPPSRPRPVARRSSWKSPSPLSDCFKIPNRPLYRRVWSSLTPRCTSAEDDSPEEERQEGHSVLPHGLRSLWNWYYSHPLPLNFSAPCPSRLRPPSACPTLHDTRTADDIRLATGRTTFVNTLCGKDVLQHKDSDDATDAHVEDGVKIKPVTVGA